MKTFQELFAAALETGSADDARSVLASLAMDPDGFSAAINELADHYAGTGLTRVVNVQEGASMVAAPAAARIGALFLNSDEFPPQNEQGMICCFTLVHGSNALEKQPAFIGPEDKVLVLCDAIDASETLLAVVERIRSVGAEVASVGALANFATDDYAARLASLGVQELFALA